MKNAPLVLLLIAAPASCILLPLIVAGALAGVGAWFLDGPGLWLVGGCLAMGLGYLAWRRRMGRPVADRDAVSRERNVES